MFCSRQCNKKTKLYSEHEHKIAEYQLKGFQVVTAEQIAHRGKGKNITSRAIIYAPVGNASLFSKVNEPKVAIIGFSTSVEAAKDFYEKYSKLNDIGLAAKESAFAGSPSLRNNLIRYANFLGLKNVLSNSFSISEMFNPSQKDILYTQIIKCCSVGKVNGIYKDSSAIYPNFINKSIVQEYIGQSGHMECVKTVFIEEMKFEKPIPFVLIFKPAWDTLNKLNLLDRVNAELIEWVPHPSNPGNKVLELLNSYENEKDITLFSHTKSTMQLVKIREKLVTLNLNNNG